MSATSILASEWRDWIVTNLNNGCTPQTLVEMMVNNRFDPAFAAASVSELAQHRRAVHADSTAAGAAYVYEPGRIASGNSITLNDRSVRVVSRLQRPDVVVFDGFMSDEECDELVRQSRVKLSRSTVVDPKTGEFNVIDDRTSDGTYFHRNENDFIARLDRRIAELMNWPLENGEGIQILRYKPGAEYKAHFDYFPVSDPGSAPQLARGGQRVSTLVMYLSDVESGGETYFPQVGLSVAPKRGSAVYFAYCNSRGQVDPASLHGGAPVIAGEKWIATKWMRQRQYV